MELIITGSGTSGCVPNISCLISKPVICRVCMSAVTDKSKNRRRNTSAILKVQHPTESRTVTILIDAGKTFYESALAWFPKYDVFTLDAVILTHGHADAMMGLDDLRQWTLRSFSRPPIQRSVPIYCDDATYRVVARTFPYTVDTKQATGSGEVASLAYNFIPETDDVQPFSIEGIQVIPFKVQHGTLSNGDPYYALGFRFGDISYVSDTNFLPDKAKSIIKGSKIIVMDGLKSTPHASHFSYTQAVDALVELLPLGGRGYLTGFTHEKDHDELNQWLKTVTPDGYHIECCYDGMKLTI